MNTKHTPTPWKQSPDFMIEGKNGDYVCRMDASEGRQHHANAAFIVKAVNAHNELVGRLEACLAYMESDSDDKQERIDYSKARSILAKVI